MAAKKKRPAAWRVERVINTPGLYRLIGPLAQRKGRQQTICVAIGNKRLFGVLEALNEMGIEI
jgi:hypothetical protein